jgi:cytochrome c peroxidase
MRKGFTLLAFLAACDSGLGPPPGEPESVPVEPSAPAPVVGPVLPELAFEGEGGTRVSLQAYRESGRLLVVRESAAFCGPCRWHAAHTSELTRSDFGARIDLVDLLVSDADNELAIPSDLAAWRTKIDVPTTLAIDPASDLRRVIAEGALPLYVLVDERTMEIRGAVSNPGPDDLAALIRREIATLDGTSLPAQPEPIRYDARFDREQWDMIREMTSPAAPPPDPTNAHADDVGAAGLGERLFADASMSPGGSVSCASCHDPKASFADGLPQSVGVARGDRNAPSASLAAHARWQFWDGRADTLWAQALGPPENAAEMGSSRLFVAHRIHERYKAEYEGVFGALPDLADVSRFPPQGKPGDVAYDAMTDGDKRAVTQVYVDFGKAIAAFERRIRVAPNALDRYVGGDRAALTDAQKAGLVSFFRVGCAQCHYGSRLTDDAFHNVGFPTGRQDGMPDPGRAAVVSTLAGAEFAAGGIWSDDRTRARVARADGAALGAFKTPSLRGVARTGPYGHGGTLATLGDVTRVYARAPTGPRPPRSAGSREKWLPPFDPAEGASLVEFLAVLTADPLVGN